MFSPDTYVAFRPEATYLQLIADAPQPPWRALTRPILIVLVIAVGVTVAAVHQVTLKLLATTGIAWSAIVVVQIAIGAVLIASAPARSRRVGFFQAMDLWFAGHLPYSLWILAFPVLTIVPIGTPHEMMAMSAIVPMVWTAFIVNAFCRVVLGLPPARARRRVALHLALALTVGCALVLWAAGGPAALISYVLRRLSAG